MSRPRLLIVDDEHAIRVALMLAFDLSTFEVDVADTGEAALRMLDARHYDALLVDKNLPGISGVDVIAHAARRKNAPICVLMTGYSTREARNAAFAAGARDYIEKPLVDVFGLIARLERWVAERRGNPMSAATALTSL